MYSDKITRTQMHCIGEDLLKLIMTNRPMCVTECHLHRVEKKNRRNYQAPMCLISQMQSCYTMCFKTLFVLLPFLLLKSLKRIEILGFLPD